MSSIFAERFGDGLIRLWARRTARLETVVYNLALAIGGRPPARIADRLGLPVSGDTLLRTVRRYARPPPPLSSAIGIDDWASRRNHRSISAIWNGERRSRCCPTENPRPRPGWSSSQKSKSSQETEASDMQRRLRKPCHGPNRSPTAGISWKR